MRATKISVNTADSEGFFDVTVSYVKVGATWSNDQPWNKDPLFSFSTETEQRALKKCYGMALSDIEASAKACMNAGLKNANNIDIVPAIAGEIQRDTPKVPVVNSLGAQFDPTPSTERHLRVISITDNQRTGQVFSSPIARELMDTINSEALTIGGVPYPKFTLKMRRLDHEAAEWTDAAQGVHNYWAIKAEIVYNPETWLVRVLDEGWMEQDGVDAYGVNKLKLLKDGDGRPLRIQVALDGWGLAKKAADDFAYLVFHDKYELDWIQYRLIERWERLPKGL
jgi:hypothetical protein